MQQLTRRNSSTRQATRDQLAQEAKALRLHNMHLQHALDDAMEGQEPCATYRTEEPTIEGTRYVLDYHRPTSPDGGYLLITCRCPRKSITRHVCGFELWAESISDHTTVDWREARDLFRKAQRAAVYAAPAEP